MKIRNQSELRREGKERGRVLLQGTQVRSPLSRTRLQVVSFDAAGTLCSLRRPVGQLYGEWAYRFGFKGGNRQDVQARLQEVFRHRFQAKPPLVLSTHLTEGAAQAAEREWWLNIVSEAFQEVAPFPRLEEGFEELYQFFGSKAAWSLEPGVSRMLLELKRYGFRLAVISNFDLRLEGLLTELGVRDFFEQLWVSSRAGSAKPDSEMFLGILKSMALRPDEALHVGDDPQQDFEGARKAGLHALLYDPKDRFGERFTNRRINCFEELMPWLSEMSTR